jgi:hypothetical protein
MQATQCAIILQLGVDVVITIFCDFRQFSAKKLAFFKLFTKTAAVWEKTPFLRKYFKIVTSVPSRHLKLVIMPSNLTFRGIRASKYGIARRVPQFVSNVLYNSARNHGPVAISAEKNLFQFVASSPTLMSSYFSMLKFRPRDFHRRKKTIQASMQLNQGCQMVYNPKSRFG